MDPAVLSQLQSLKLINAEEHGPLIEPSDFSSSAEDCKKSLIGKIHGDKVANYTGIKSTFSSLWTNIAPFKLRELGKNLFHFFFASHEDLQIILHHKAWTFDGQFLLLKPWQEDLDLLNLSFNSVPIWIQIWNLPPHWLSKEIGLRFKSLFTDVIDVLIPEGGSRKGCYLKILAEIDLSKPLLRGTKLRFKDQVIWVRFEYERMASFCFYCGLVGHLEKNCVSRLRDAKSGNLTVGQFGDWMRASNFTPSVKAQRPAPLVQASPPVLDTTQPAVNVSSPLMSMVTPPNSPKALPSESPSCEFITEGPKLAAQDGATTLITQRTIILDPPPIPACNFASPSGLVQLVDTSGGEQSLSNMIIDQPLVQFAPVARAHLAEQAPHLFPQELINVPIQFSKNKGILAERSTNIPAVNPSNGQN